MAQPPHAHASCADPQLAAATQLLLRVGELQQLGCHESAADLLLTLRRPPAPLWPAVGETAYMLARTLLLCNPRTFQTLLLTVRRPPASLQSARLPHSALLLQLACLSTALYPRQLFLMQRCHDGAALRAARLG